MKVSIYKLFYMCKTQINVQPLIDIKSSDLCPFFKFSNRHPIVEYTMHVRFSLSQCPNPNQ